jgi:hypothetical protein
MPATLRPKRIALSFRPLQRNSHRAQLKERHRQIAIIACYVAGEDGVDCSVSDRRFESFGETDPGMTALILGIRPDLLLIKQVDQVGALNGKLPPAGGSPGPSPRRRRNVFGAGADAGGPAAGHGLKSGIMHAAPCRRRRVEPGDDDICRKRLN